MAKSELNFSESIAYSFPVVSLAVLQKYAGKTNVLESITNVEIKDNVISIEKIKEVTNLSQKAFYSVVQKVDFKNELMSHEETFLTGAHRFGSDTIQESSVYRKNSETTTEYKKNITLKSSFLLNKYVSLLHLYGMNLLNKSCITVQANHI